MRATPWIASLALLGACAESPERAAARMRTEAEALRPQVEAMHAQFSRGAAQGNADTMLALYAPDAVLMPPNRPLQTLDSAKALFAAVGPYQVSFATRSLTVNGPVAVERGNWSAVMSPPGSPFAVVRDGKYVAHWHRGPDGWRITEHIWNDDYRPLGM